MFKRQQLKAAENSRKRPLLMGKIGAILTPLGKIWARLGQDKNKKITYGFKTIRENYKSILIRQRPNQ